MTEELFLIYINELGKNWKGDYLYEFIYSNTLEVDGEDWDVYPASGSPDAPDPNYVLKVGVLGSDMKFECIQNSDTFAVWDAVDGVIALAWEDIGDYEEYPDRRIYFNFGDKIKNVEDKLYEKDLMLKYNINRNERLKEENTE